MVYELDAGPILAEAKVTLDGDEFHNELKEVFSEVGSELLIDLLPHLFARDIEAVPQDVDQATFCKKTKKEDALVDLSETSPLSLWRKYRAYYGWPGIYFIENSKRVKITEATFDEEEKIFTIQKIICEGEKEKAYHRVIR